MEEERTLLTTWERVGGRSKKKKNRKIPPWLSVEISRCLENIAEFGWHVTLIPEEEDSPAWAFTTGLFQQYQHPELVIFGQSHELMHSVLNQVGEAVRDGSAFAEDQRYPEFLEGYDILFKSVNPAYFRPFMGHSVWYYQKASFPCYQIFWPGQGNEFPWEFEEYNPSIRYYQPALFADEEDDSRLKELVQIILGESE